MNLKDVVSSSLSMVWGTILSLEGTEKT